MNKIYVKGNYLYIILSNGNKIINPKKDVIFYRNGGDIFTFSSKNLAQGGEYDWKTFQKENGTSFTNVDEFEKFVTENTSNFNSGSGIDPQNFDLDNLYIAGGMNSNKLFYKTDTYREINLQDLIGITVNNINEIIRINNNFFMTINYTFDGSISQKIVALRNCVIRNNELFIGKVNYEDTGIKSVHSLVYNDFDGLIYVADRAYGERIFTISKIEPGTLKTVKVSSFPNTESFKYAVTDVKIYNNKLYFPIGYNTNYKFIEMSTNLVDYTVLYEVTTSTPARWHQSNQPFVLYNGKAYITCYDDYVAADRLRHTKIVEINLITKAFRVSGKIPVNNSSIGAVQTHWITIYNDKLMVTTASFGSSIYISSLMRIDISTLLKEDEINFDFPITDDNSIINGYIYLNGESFFGTSWIDSYPNYPKNNAKLISINPMDFTDKKIEIDLFNNGYGSNGSINHSPKNVLQMSDLRLLINP